MLGSYSGVAEDSSLQGYYTVSTGKELRMFRRSVVPSSSESSSPGRVIGLYDSEDDGTTNPRNAGNSLSVDTA
jgi:hypothetical protein